MSFSVPKLVPLQLGFRVLAPINKLPVFHGVQWSALLREGMKAAFSNPKSLNDAGIVIQPIESGIVQYVPGDVISFGMTFPVEQTDVAQKLLEVLKDNLPTSGYFIPGKTIQLETVTCRLSGTPWSSSTQIALSMDAILPEIERLRALTAFDIVFTTPLRLSRSNKKPGHRYCDEEFFNVENSAQIAHLASRVCANDEAINFVSSPSIVSSGLLWQEFSWGEAKKTVGGVVGSVRCAGEPDDEMAFRLVLGQHTGVGLSRSLGFGCYTIPDLDAVRRIVPLSRSTTLLARACAVDALRCAVDRLPRSVPGPDGMSVEDAKKSGDVLLCSLAKRLQENSYIPGPSAQFAIPKHDGTSRIIHVQNITDRIVQRSITDVLTPAIEAVLSSLAFAYRKNRNRRGALRAVRHAFAEGYTHGIKTDIDSFFDSVNLVSLHEMLMGLIPYEPLVGRIFSSLPMVDPEHQKGLPQGSPLSPLLSNLYLQRFDREIAQQNLRLIRYADDCVVLAREDMPEDKIREQIEKALLPLGLRLNSEKTIAISSDRAFTFLGYSVKGTVIEELEGEAQKDDSPWHPLFNEQWHTGIPVYISTLCQSAVSRNGSLVLTDETAQQQEILWKNVGRIVIAGRTHFSGSVMYRAMRHRIPVAFVDILGRLNGQFRPEQEILPNLREPLEQISRQSEIQKMYASAVVAAKIHNSAVLLKRNHIESPELKSFAREARIAKNIESLRGIEGAAAKEYFSKFALLVSPFQFTGRVYHPSPDPVNVMLSFGYTLLYNRLSSALYAKGFEARIGFYHQGRGTHAALASDLMEPLRHLVDRTVLAMIHRGEITTAHFTQKTENSDVFRLSGDGFRIYINRFEKTMSMQFTNSHGIRLSYNAYLDDVADEFKRSLQFGTPYEPLEID
jgi:group II intron reverse transcriptase/maturase/CRISPR-associated endonuclease Cas1